VDLRPPLKKSLGQHLLKDKNLLRKMVRLSGLTGRDSVVEIGPGHGDLTRCVAEVARSVVAIELDERLREVLEPLEKEFPNLRLLFSDVVEVEFADLARHGASDGAITVMGNIPYNVTGEILFKVLAARSFVKGAYLTMQKEVADRLVARSHTRDYGALSVIFQLAADVKLLLNLKASLFVPPPKVQSAFVSIVFRQEARIDEGLISFVKTCFRYKRKFLRHSLEDRIETSDIERIYRDMAFLPNIRAEEIEPEGFVRMYRLLGTQERR
jgi:16S rRNA (adenine1518-N6/adenine1519-N6)-dimethyltransferase